MVSGLETLIKQYVVLQLRLVDLHWVMCLPGLLQLDQNLETNLEKQIGHGWVPLWHWELLLQLFRLAT
jgi:hypothetical protein